ncbi:hypothetical protein DSECCO2_634650 [anaerobic digester metagenome]
MLVAGTPPGGLGEPGQFVGIHDVVVGDVGEEVEHPLLVGVGRLPRDDPDRDPSALRLLGDHNLPLPVEVEDRRVESVVVELEGVALEEEVHLPGLERGIRRETQVLRHRERFLPSKAEINAEEDERHEKDEKDRKTVKDACRPVEDRGPAVGIRRLLPHVRDIRREAADLPRKGRIEDHLDVQRVVLGCAPRDDDGLRRPLDSEGRGMSVDLLDIAGERERDPEVPEGDVLVDELQVQVRPLLVVLDWRPDPVAVLHRVGAGVEVAGVKEAHLVSERKVPDDRNIRRGRVPGGRPDLVFGVLDVADGSGRGGHPDELDVRPVDGRKGERCFPVAKEHPVLPRRTDVVGIALDEGPILEEDGVIRLDLEIAPEKVGERCCSRDRQHPGKKGDGNKDGDLLSFSHAHRLSERYRRDALDLLAELQVLKFRKAHDPGDQVRGNRVGHGVVLLGDVVVGVAVPGDLVLDPSHRAHQFLDRLRSLEVGIVLGDGEQPPEDRPGLAFEFIQVSRAGAADAGPHRGHAGQGLLLECRVALHRAEELLDHIQPLLHRDLHLSDRCFGGVFEGEEPVIYAN